ncbi:acyltransferase [Methylobacterium sp. NEAU 140]|uniref:acyltransferase family protein n=1 Tax=Methylobacterium sp. NEAU 140 TaxID=3064945 RepID=UPI002735E877|nr:acyltransferase [Methylobacterium sp. NEAU 140]MDP4021919.1 acyltransferase [Methylobacterium sp. NEAU 140]
MNDRASACPLMTSRGRNPISASPIDSIAARNQALDALRGLAALVVVLHHFCWSYEVRVGPHNTDLPSLVHGHFAVELFFILSGFVIAPVLERARSPTTFALQRAARLYPTFLVCSALTLVVLAVDNRLFLAPLHVLGGLTMLGRMLQMAPIDAPHWSLSYEVLFYLLAAFVLRRAPERACAIWLAAIFLGTLVLPDWALRFAILLQLPYAVLFIIGMMLSRLVMGRLGLLGFGTLATALGLTGLGPVVDLGGLGSAGYVVLILSFSGIVWGAGKGYLRWIACRPLVFLGAISYPLYLSHYSIGHVIIRCLEAENWSALSATAAALMMVVIIATIIHYAVEVPAQFAIRRIWATHICRRAQATA